MSITGLIQRYFSRGLRITLLLPEEAFQAIRSLKMHREEGFIQTLQSALQTHSVVVDQLRQGRRIVSTDLAGNIVPINLEHIQTPEKRRSSFTLIKGDR